MAWWLLAGAIVTEVAATTALAYSHGLTRPPITALTALLYVASYVLLARALHAHLDVSVAYAVWSGVGTAALAVIGAALFRESLTTPKIIAIGLIIAGVALLNLTHRTTDDPTSAPTASATVTPPPGRGESHPPITDPRGTS